MEKDAVLNVFGKWTEKVLKWRRQEERSKHERQRQRNVCNGWRTGTKVQQKQWTTTIAGFSSRENSELSRLYTGLYWCLKDHKRGKVGIGCYIKIDTKRVSETAIRVTNNVSVYTGEMACSCPSRVVRSQNAGYRPERESCNLYRLTEHSPHNRIWTFGNSTEPAERDIRSKTRVKTWSNTRMGAQHIGIAGNEKANRVANDGTGKQKVEIDVGLELKETYNMADKYCAKKWQEKWSNSKTSHYKSIGPKVKTGKTSLYKNRR